MFDYILTKIPKNYNIVWEDILKFTLNRNKQALDWILEVTSPSPLTIEGHPLIVSWGWILSSAIKPKDEH